jgi:hypothetical protein
MAGHEMMHMGGLTCGERDVLVAEVSARALLNPYVSTAKITPALLPADLLPKPKPCCQPSPIDKRTSLSSIPLNTFD